MDLAFFGKMKTLRTVQISGFGVGTLLGSQVLNADSICTSSNVETLTVGSVQIDSLHFLSNCKKLIEMNLSRMPITSITEVSALRYLKKLTLTDIPVVDISPLLGLPNLESLFLLRVPARADVIAELERRGVKITNP